MSVAAKGNAYKQAIQEGYDKNQAQAYSIMIGALEGGLQYALGGIGKLGGKVSGSLLQQATKEHPKRSRQSSHRTRRQHALRGWRGVSAGDS